jgi:hypothetical protein
MLALDSSTRILQVIGYSGFAALVGLLVGLALRFSFKEVARKAEAAKRQAESAMVTADEARSLAWQARDEAHAVEA